ncbi:MAG: biotin--[acetyl-CoA-carboxylase] ligase [Spirochaetales bacterium]|nr:biotin--[acetyl-CoA-carboxylase] ligase [Spirochaetales bacterium]
MPDVIKKKYHPGKIKNRFQAQVYYTESTTSTMDDAKYFAARGSVHGTVVCAGFQTKGRGRFPGRKWMSDPGGNLLFTIILKKTMLPFSVERLPVIIGFILCVFCEEYLGFSPSIKWPNDILYHHKKITGILCEADGENVFCGIGMNCNQELFPGDLKHTSASIFTITGKKNDPILLCEKVLGCMYREIENIGQNSTNPQFEVEKRLYNRGQKVKVIAGTPEKVLAEGLLSGIDEDGALLVLPEGEKFPVRVIAGEMVFVDD